MKLWLYLGIGLLLALMLSGCGTGVNPSQIGQPPGDGGGDGTLQLTYPLENPAALTAIGGTIFTLASAPDGTEGAIDQAYNAEVTLIPDSGGQTLVTRSTVRGGYQFGNLAAGMYTVRARVSATDGSNRTLQGEVRIAARGNIPALMTNLLLAESTKTATISGIINDVGTTRSPAANATVSLQITAFSTEHLRNSNNQDMVDVFLATTTDANGRYTLTVPTQAMYYYVSAHNDKSMSTDSEELSNLQAGNTYTVDLTLLAAESPNFAGLLMDSVTVTLPAPTVAAEGQVLTTRLAAARALGASSERLAHLQQLATTRRPATRAVPGQVETDLYWALNATDLGVLGFNIYRSAQRDQGFTFIGNTPDPYQFYFFDNDPALAVGQTSYYVITSYAANGKVSTPSRTVTAAPLPVITTVAPAENAEVTPTDRLQWQAVSGASSYLVFIFNTEPTFNAFPVTYAQLPAGSTGLALSQVLAGQPNGTYWWSVSAYNHTNPGEATSATYSAYQRLQLK